jgi:chemotaxis signal transduction protein
VSAFESGRRLCLLFEAGACRYAIEATAVTEVATPDEDGRTLRGALELRDLTHLLGAEEEEARPGMAVVLDVSPTLALRVRRVHEVVDVARDRHFGIPPALGESLAFVTRGAILHRDMLFLELKPEAIPQQPLRRPAPLPRTIYLLDRPPDRALVFESQGVLFGLPLSLVSQVVPATDSFLPMPVPSGPVAGVFPHAQLLWPVFSAPALLGGRPAQEALLVLAELAGEAAGLCASRVKGVVSAFEPTDGCGEFTATGTDRPILFLDLQRMFS